MSSESTEEPQPARKMHADELDIDVPLVRRLLAAQFPEWTALPIEAVRPLGTDNAIFRIGQDVVARLPRREVCVAPLLKECEWLPQLAPLLPLAIPAPLAKGAPGDGYPLDWAIYRWLEGELATVERITDLSEAAIDMAKFILALQSIDASGGPLPDNRTYRGVPLARRDPATRAAIVSLQNEIDPKAVTAAWEEALQAPEWQGPPVWIHGDLDSRNLLVKNGRLTAVIDYGCLTVGDPATDVMVAWKLFSSDNRNIFQAHLSVDEATWMRSRGWALSQALIALAYYTLETNRTLVLEARRWMAEVLADRDRSSRGG